MGSKWLTSRKREAGLPASATRGRKAQPPRRSVGRAYYIPGRFGTLLHNPHSHGDKLRESLKEVLGPGRRPQEWYPWWDWMDERKGKWSLLVPDLQDECGMAEGGEIMNYFVERFAEVARAALPVIDKFEKNGRDTR